MFKLNVFTNPIRHVWKNTSTVATLLFLCKYVTQSSIIFLPFHSEQQQQTFHSCPLLKCQTSSYLLFLLYFQSRIVAYLCLYPSFKTGTTVQLLAYFQDQSQLYLVCWQLPETLSICCCAEERCAVCIICEQYMHDNLIGCVQKGYVVFCVSLKVVGEKIMALLKTD